jgi:hypothetical protein
MLTWKLGGFRSILPHFSLTTESDRASFFGSSQVSGVN